MFLLARANRKPYAAPLRRLCQNSACRPHKQPVAPPAQIPPLEAQRPAPRGPCRTRRGFPPQTSPRGPPNAWPWSAAGLPSGFDGRSAIRERPGSGLRNPIGAKRRELLRRRNNERKVPRYPEYLRSVSRRLHEHPRRLPSSRATVAAPNFYNFKPVLGKEPSRVLSALIRANVELETVRKIIGISEKPEVNSGPSPPDASLEQLDKTSGSPTCLQTSATRSTFTLQAMPNDVDKLLAQATHKCEDAPPSVRHAMSGDKLSKSYQRTLATGEERLRCSNSHFLAVATRTSPSPIFFPCVGLVHLLQVPTSCAFEPLPVEWPTVKLPLCHPSCRQCCPHRGGTLGANFLDLLTRRPMPIELGPQFLQPQDIR